MITISECGVNLLLFLNTTFQSDTGFMDMSNTSFCEVETCSILSYKPLIIFPIVHKKYPFKRVIKGKVKGTLLSLIFFDHFKWFQKWLQLHYNSFQAQFLLGAVVDFSSLNRLVCRYRLEEIRGTHYFQNHNICKTLTVCQLIVQVTEDHFCGAVRKISLWRWVITLFECRVFSDRLIEVHRLLLR